MTYNQAVIVQRTGYCVRGYVQCPQGRKRWVLDSFKAPHYWSVSDRTMDVMVRNGWMFVFEEDGKRYAKCTIDGQGASLEALARHYTRYAKRWKKVRRSLHLQDSEEDAL